MTLIRYLPHHTGFTIQHQASVRFGSRTSMSSISLTQQTGVYHNCGTEGTTSVIYPECVEIKNYFKIIKCT